MNGKRQKTPERSCLYCKYGHIRAYQIECTCEESLYFEGMMNRFDSCPEFIKGKEPYKLR